MMNQKRFDVIQRFSKCFFSVHKTLSWRRVTMCMGLQVFAGYALMQGTLDPTTWAYFAGSICGMYVGGDTGEKIAKHFKKDVNDEHTA